MDSGFGLRFEFYEGLVTVAKFGETERAREAEAGVAAGTINGVSIGYRIDEMTLVEKAGEHFHPWGMAEENRPIYLCRGLRHTIAEYWTPDFKHWN